MAKKNSIVRSLVDFKEFFLERTCEGRVEDIKRQVRGPINFGLVAVSITVGFFIIWANLAPIDSAVYTSGYFRLSDNKKVIQHHEGGVVQEILVKDGDFVKKGDALIILNNSRAKAEIAKFLWNLGDHFFLHEVLQKKLKLLEYIRSGKNFRDFNASIERPISKYIDYSNAVVNEMWTQQENLFNTYKNFIGNNIVSLRYRIKHREAEVKSLEAKIMSVENHIQIYKEEHERILQLLKGGLYTRDRAAEIASRLQSYEGDLKESRVRLLQAEYLLSEAKILVFTFLDKESVDSYEAFKKNITVLNITESQYLNALDIFERTVVRSPNDGEVTDMQVYTISSSLQPNMKLLEIIPKNDNLIIEAEVLSRDIDGIIIGGKVKVQLDAYKTKVVPRINGEVIYISADKFDKPLNSVSSSMHHSSFYRIKIKIQQKELDKINHGVILKSGMPVHIFVVKGTKTLAQYLYSPLVDGFRRALIEE